MTHRPTSDITSVAIAQFTQSTPALAHIVEYSRTRMIKEMIVC
jgi:hypothetical protein